MIYQKSHENTCAPRPPTPPDARWTQNHCTMALSRRYVPLLPPRRLPRLRSYLSARNIPYLNLISLDNLNARDIVRAKKVVVSTSALETIQSRYGA